MRTTQNHSTGRTENPIYIIIAITFVLSGGWCLFVEQVCGTEPAGEVRLLRCFAPAENASIDVRFAMERGEYACNGIERRAGEQILNARQPLERGDKQLSVQQLPVTVSVSLIII